MRRSRTRRCRSSHWVYTAAEHWHLELRPGIDGADSPENVESWYSVLREGVRQKQLNDAGVDRIPAVGVSAMNNESIRIYVTGSCEGLDNLRDQLANYPDLDFVGWSENVAEGDRLAGGHLRVVVHATRSTSFPAGEVAAIREHTRSPIVILASGESSACSRTRSTPRASPTSCCCRS